MVHKVFISHAFANFELFDSLVSRFNRERFNWIDCSVPRHRRYLADGSPLPDEEMKRLLAAHIDSCDVVVVIAKPIVGRRPWLRWELDYAKSVGKPILAVWRRQVDLHVAKFARDRADKCVDTWHIWSIMRAIEELSAQAPATPKPRVKVALDAIPEVSAQPVTEEVVVPAVAPSPEPLAPVDELALTPGEKIVPETPREVLAPVLEPGPRPEALRTPLENIAPNTGLSGSAELPKSVIIAAQTKRRWWQFWKPRDVAALRPN